MHPLNLALISTALGAFGNVAFKYLLGFLSYQEIALIESAFLVLFFSFKTPTQFFTCTQKEKLLVLTGSILNGLTYILFFLSLSELPLIEFSFIGRNQVLISIFLGILFFRERYSLTMWLAMTLALLGAYCFTYTSLQEGSILGLIYAGLYCLTTSLRGLFLKIGPNLHAREHMLWGAFFSLLFVLLHCTCFSSECLNWERIFTGKPFLMVIITSFFAQVIGITIYLRAIYEGGLSEVSSVRATSPFFVFLYSLALLPYPWTPLKILAVLLCSLSIFLFIYEKKAASRRVKNT